MRTVRDLWRLRQGSSRVRNHRLALAAIPTVVVLAVGALAVPYTHAQDSGLSSQLGLKWSSSGISDSIAPGDAPERTPIRTEHPALGELPEGVSVEKVEYLTDRHVRVYIKSAAMPESTMMVQILLARDWYSNPTEQFPEVWALDGLRATDEESGWTIETNIEQFYADKNVNVIMPVGGESSFYSDWEQPDNGKNYKWETFLINELIPVLQQGFRSNGDRAITGISMGGTAAMNLAERHPDLWKFVGSFSGYLDTTSFGMSTAILAAQRDAGNFDGTKMWGTPGSQDWIDHDPKLGVANLKDMTVYVSAGSGREDSLANTSNYAGMGLEVISRMTSQTFVDRATQAGVKVAAVFRDSGVHSWEYWQFEMAQAWPTIAEALKLSEADRGANCNPVGAISDLTRNGEWGTCLNDEYDVQGGRAQDFRDGRAFWSAETGAYIVNGAISAKYTESGDASSWLGFPITNEQTTPDGVGRYNHFQNGSIYWTPDTGAIAVPADIVAAWGTVGYEGGTLGYPLKDPVTVGSSVIQQFQHGFIVRSADNQHYIVHGAIADRYAEDGGAESSLGLPTSDEQPLNGGAYQQFEHGAIYWSATTGAHTVVDGALRTFWGDNGWENGKFGYPISEPQTILGGTSQSFQGGTLTETAGQVTAR